MNKYIIAENRIYKKVEDEFTCTYEESDAIPRTSKIPFKWKGDKITPELFHTINAFFLWTFQKWQAESQVRLFYNTQTKEWKAQPFPQKIAKGSMTTEDENCEETRSLFPDPWVYLGTAHHHCSTKAFQSGTDHANELNQDGFHYTIGNLNSKELDFHGRFSWSGSLFDVDIFDLVYAPKWIEQAPDELQYEFAKKTLLMKLDGVDYTDFFPKKWQEKIIEKAERQVTRYAGITHPDYDGYTAYKWRDIKTDKGETDEEKLINIEAFWTPFDIIDIVDKSKKKNKSKEDEIIVQELVMEISAEMPEQETDAVMMRLFTRANKEIFKGINMAKDYLEEMKLKKDDLIAIMEQEGIGPKTDKWIDILRKLEANNISIEELMETISNLVV
jgi:hypothetical protein